MSSKVLKIVSLIAFLILLSPTNFFYLMLFIAASAVFVPVFIRKSNYINADISTISLLMSILVNLSYLIPSDVDDRHMLYRGLLIVRITL